MTKMANRINKYQSLRLTIWKIASNVWFTAALAILLRPVKTVAKFQWKLNNIFNKISLQNYVASNSHFYISFK